MNQDSDIFFLSFLASLILHVSGVIFFMVNAEPEVLNVDLEAVQVKVGVESAHKAPPIQQEILESVFIDQDDMVGEGQWVLSMEENEVAPMVEGLEIEAESKPEGEVPVQRITKASKKRSLPRIVPQKKQVIQKSERPKGVKLGNSKKGEEIIKRYTQELALWLNKHKISPEYIKKNRLEGMAQIRLRINRRGEIQIAKISKTSGSHAVDEAILSMAKSANPLPPVPDDYESGDLFEFVFPIRLIGAKD